MGLWFCTKQLVLVPQLQGFLHIRLMHVSLLGQSESAVHPGGIGTTTGRHSPSLLGTHPSGQVQIMVRTGIVSSTLQRDEVAQGDSAMQGLTQVLRIQAS